MPRRTVRSPRCWCMPATAPMSNAKASTSPHSSDSITPFGNDSLTFEGERVLYALRASSLSPAFGISISNLPLAAVS
ncbi:exported hypothetical protein [Agrobacterium genomosp. 5 str. CFBP 6626]|nr:exported hypothetical protein [Agrobacterium genomosp. 5 str. CFBP 6626]